MDWEGYGNQIHTRTKKYDKCQNGPKNPPNKTIYYTIKPYLNCSVYFVKTTVNTHLHVNLVLQMIITPRKAMRRKKRKTRRKNRNGCSSQSQRNIESKGKKNLPQKFNVLTVIYLNSSNCSSFVSGWEWKSCKSSKKP